MRNDKISLLKGIDHWVGGPICIGLSLIYRLLHPFYKTSLSVPPQDLPPKHVLIVKFFGLGSITLASSLITNIRNQYKDVKIIFLTFKDNVVILNLLSLCDEILLVDTKNPFKLLGSILRTIWVCRQRKIDIVMDIEFYSKFSTIMSFMSGAKWRIGFYMARFWRNSLVNVPIYFNYSRHILEIYDMFAKALLINAIDLYPKKINITQQDKEELAVVLRECQVDVSHAMAINIHASDLALCRRWPLPKFVALLEELLLAYPQWTIVLTGGKNEKAYSQEFLQMVPPQYRSRIIDLTGKLTLKQFLTLLSQLPLFITNDTGPFHLAKAVDARTISLWGPGSVDLYGPYGDEKKSHDVVYKRYPCSPCLYVYRTDAGFFCGHKAPCMEEIQPADVMALVGKYIKS
jgi:ADP-heptose:LPS heptosyltransferase